MADHIGWKPALLAALGKIGETLAVRQVALTSNLIYTIPEGTPSGIVHRVVFTQDGTGGHTVTYGGAPVTVALTAGASTTVELHPVGGGYVVRYPAVGVCPTAPGKNLLDVSVGQDNYFWNDGGATPLALAGYWASPKIPVTPGQQYTTQAIRSIQFFDSSGGRVAGTLYVNDATFGINAVTVPAGRYFMAVSTTIAKKSTSQIEAGAVATAYEPYGLKIPLLIAGGDLLDNQIAKLSSPTSESLCTGVVVCRSGNAMLVRVPHDSTKDVVIPLNLASMATTPGDERVRMSTPGWSGVRRIDRTTLNSAIWPIPAALPGESIHDAGDDSAPIYTGAGYIGANHGWNGGSLITMTNHGKVATDLGSTWTDGTRTYTLLRIIDANTVLLGNPYTVAGGVVSIVTTIPAATLTHVAGATNKASITITGGASLIQIKPTSHTRTVTATLDGVAIKAGVSTGRVLSIAETYTVISFKGLIDWAQANIGVDPFVDLTTKASHSRITTTYRWEGRTCIVGQTITALEAMAATQIVTQAACITVPSGSARQYIPGATGTVAGIDLTTMANLASQTGDINVAVAQQLDAATPVSRAYQWRFTSAGAPDYGILIGLLPVMDGKLATRKTNGTDATSWFVPNSTKKNYPRLSFGKALAIGESLSGVGFRRYLSSADPVEVVISDGSRSWVLIDTPTAHATPTVARVPDVHGRALSVVGATSMTTDRAYVTPEGVTYTNTAPGHLLAEAVVDTSV